MKSTLRHTLFALVIAVAAAALAGKNSYIEPEIPKRCETGITMNGIAIGSECSDSVGEVYGCKVLVESGTVRRIAGGALERDGRVVLPSTTNLSQCVIALGEPGPSCGPDMRCWNLDNHSWHLELRTFAGKSGQLVLSGPNYNHVIIRGSR